ncbi:MAG: disulfide bond formation protein B [Gemmatimonadaceae bacterium]|nr:disulfide bond formation protein B [Gemmatimonadaceae bacterium]
MTQPSSAVSPTANRGDLVFTITALAVLFLTVVPIGIAVFFLGFVKGDSPCVMCWEQRIGMILISLVGLFVLRFGPKPKYVGMAVLIAAWGMFMGLRHVGMHGARDIGQGFSIEILGAHTYTWALFTYWVCVIAMGALLLMVRPQHLDGAVRVLRPLERFTGWAFVVIVAANAVQAFASTGPPPFMGQSDPIRFSFNPKHWHWSLEEWKPPIKYALRGRWNVAKPDASTADVDVSKGPLGLLPTLAVGPRTTLGVALKGTPTDFAYDAASDRFLVTTDAAGIYLLDGTLTKLDRHTIVDIGYSVDLGRFAGAAFLDKGQLIAVGENKSFVVLAPSDTADADENFRYFLESANAFEEVNRSRFGTVRARMMYINAAAYDVASNSIYTITVPNQFAKRMIVSRFDRRDMVLSEEFIPTLAKGAGLTLGDDRSLGEYMITGATVADGRLYAISAAYRTLLVMELDTHRVLAAFAVPNLPTPVGLAARGTDLLVLGADGSVTSLARPVVPTITAPVDSAGH